MATKEKVRASSDDAAEAARDLAFHGSDLARAGLDQMSGALRQFRPEQIGALMESGLIVMQGGQALFGKAVALQQTLARELMSTGLRGFNDMAQTTGQIADQALRSLQRAAPQQGNGSER